MIPVELKDLDRASHTMKASAVFILQVLVQTLVSSRGTMAQNCRHQVVSNSKLLKMDCSHKDFTFVPSFAEPSQITSLNLDFNKISVLRNNEFVDRSGNGMINLKSVSLRGNNMTSIERSAFNGLIALETLILHNNSLFTALYTSSQIFQPLQNNLRVLDIRQNIKGSIPPKTGYPIRALAPLRALEELLMDGLDRKPLDPGFRKLGSLRKLVFAGGRRDVVHIPDSAFRPVPHLTELDMSGQSMSHCSF